MEKTTSDNPIDEEGEEQEQEQAILNKKRKKKKKKGKDDSNSYSSSSTNPSTTLLPSQVVIDCDDFAKRLADDDDLISVITDGDEDDEVDEKPVRRKKKTKTGNKSSRKISGNDPDDGQDAKKKKKTKKRAKPKTIAEEDHDAMRISSHRLIVDEQCARRSVSRGRLVRTGSSNGLRGGRRTKKPIGQHRKRQSCPLVLIDPSVLQALNECCSDDESTSGEGLCATTEAPHSSRTLFESLPEERDEQAPHTLKRKVHRNEPNRRRGQGRRTSSPPLLISPSELTALNEICNDDDEESTNNDDDLRQVEEEESENNNSVTEKARNKASTLTSAEKKRNDKRSSTKKNSAATLSVGTQNKTTDSSHEEKPQSPDAAAEDSAGKPAKSPADAKARVETVAAAAGEEAWRIPATNESDDAIKRILVEKARDKNNPINNKKAEPEDEDDAAMKGLVAKARNEAATRASAEKKRNGKRRIKLEATTRNAQQIALNEVCSDDESASNVHNAIPLATPHSSRMVGSITERDQQMPPGLTFPLKRKGRRPKPISSRWATPLVSKNDVSTNNSGNDSAEAAPRSSHAVDDSKRKSDEQTTPVSPSPTKLQGHRNKPNRSRDERRSSSPSVLISPSGELLLALNSNEVRTDEETTSNPAPVASHSSHTASTDGSSSSEGDPLTGAKSSNPKSSWGLLGGRNKPNRRDQIRKSSPSVLISPADLTALNELEKNVSAAEDQEELEVKSIATSGSMKKNNKWLSAWRSPEDQEELEVKSIATSGSMKKNKNKKWRSAWRSPEDQEEFEVKSIASSGSMKKNKNKKWRSAWRSPWKKKSSKKIPTNITTSLLKSERHYSDFF